MSMTDTTKICGMCCMEIPAEARKCPHCHHFQNRLTLIMSHPASAIIVALIPMACMLIVFQRTFDRGQDYQAYAGQVQITESRIAFGEDESGGTVVVMGTIRNDSPIPWKEIRFQVEFQDATGARSDTGQVEAYTYYLPAHSSLSFKTSHRRQFPEANYVNHTISVVSAKDARSRW